jgi:L-aminopeptidase/D-esterase-like protein
MRPDITAVSGIRVGSAQDSKALTGCTVILVEEGATCGVDVRGGAPGTRETDVLDPVNTVDQVHAVVLTGGTVYGLESAQGVMRYLEECGKGLDMGSAVVPIVPAAVIYDLPVGDGRVRPDLDMGYQAARGAGLEVKEGNYGAGAGATVGKIKGYESCTKSGQGSYAVELPGGLVIGALAVVNAFGDVLFPYSGEVLAGVQNPKGNGFAGTIRVLKAGSGNHVFPPAANTTLAVVASNARFSKAQAKKVAMMSHNGLVRVINPVHTGWDGDTVFALATGEVEADMNLVGILSQEVLAEAIIRAVWAAESVPGIKSARDILQGRIDRMPSFFGKEGNYDPGLGCR